MLTKCGGKKVAGKSVRGQMMAVKWERMAADVDHDQQVAAMVLASRDRDVNPKGAFWRS